MDAPGKIVFGSDISCIFAKAAGLTIEQYEKEVDVTTKLHKICKPFFFISTQDDPFFGPKVIPIGHCHDNILLGVLKHGGHCCNIEGGILPTGQWWTKPSMVFIDHFTKEAIKTAQSTTEMDSSLSYFTKPSLLISPKRSLSPAKLLIDSNN